MLIILVQAIDDGIKIRTSKYYIILSVSTGDLRVQLCKSVIVLRLIDRLKTSNYTVDYYCTVPMLLFKSRTGGYITKKSRSENIQPGTRYSYSMFVSYTPTSTKYRIPLYTPARGEGQQHGNHMFTWCGFFVSAIASLQSRTQRQYEYSLCHKSTSSLGELPRYCCIYQISGKNT